MQISTETQQAPKRLPVGIKLRLCLKANKNIPFKNGKSQRDERLQTV